MAMVEMRDEMTGMATTSRRWFIVALASSLVLAIGGWLAPQTRMPLDYHNMLWHSIPLACLLALAVGLSAYRFGRNALWMLPGAPVALYWPIWLLFHGLPLCATGTETVSDLKLPPSSGTESCDTKIT